MATSCSTTTSAIATFNSIPTTTSFPQLKTNRIFFNLIPISNVKRPSLIQLFIKTRRKSIGVSRYASTSTPFRPVSPVMEWQDCTVRMEVDIPISVAYNCYSDREAIARWMPFISSVKILEDKPDLSRWTLKYKAFGRDIEFSWLARNMQ
ncbi:Polyketide cyclase / dehydrase and lipid transport protein, partial [Thalictrum thalictroides]